jgi:ATP-dependent DNA ligase
VTVDGELVCLRPDGRPDFAQLRRRLTGCPRNRQPAMLQVFDLLHLDGCSTRALPYRERQALLEKLALELAGLANAGGRGGRAERGLGRARRRARP